MVRVARVSWSRYWGYSCLLCRCRCRACDCASLCAGAVKEGLLLHQDDERIIYPLGSTVVVKHLTKNIQHFLQKDGHDNGVSCLALSPNGKFLASGQNAPLGFPVRYAS